MTTEEWFDKAIAYFNGTMSSDQSQLFENETAASEELSKLMQLWKSLNTEAPVYEQFNEDAANFVKTHQRLRADFIGDVPQIPAAKKLKIWRWVAVAATVAGIIIVMKFFTPSSHNNSPVAEHRDTSANSTFPDSVVKHYDAQNLYAQYFAADKVPEDPNGFLDDAFFYYASAQYKKAIIAIDGSRNKALTRGESVDAKLTAFYAAYYKGLSLLSLDSAATAVTLLNESIAVAPSALLKTKAQWYLALGYLKQENITAAKTTLQLLTNSHSAGYQSKAAKLLEELNK